MDFPTLEDSKFPQIAQRISSSVFGNADGNLLRSFASAQVQLRAALVILKFSKSEIVRTSLSKDYFADKKGNSEDHEQTNEQKSIYP